MTIPLIHSFRISCSYCTFSVFFFSPMSVVGGIRGRLRLSPEVNRILYVRNLPYKIKNDELYDIFGKYGPIRQIRIGNAQGNRRTILLFLQVLEERPLLYMMTSMTRRTQLII
jgi:hypothetical protein